MPFVKAGPLAALPPGTAAELEIERRVYAVCNAEGDVYAIAGICPHMGGRLAHGALNGHRLACPWHCWEFDVRTGEGDVPSQRVKTYPVRVEHGEIYIDTGAGTTRS